jgi:hypothetical protein
VSDYRRLHACGVGRAVNRQSGQDDQAFRIRELEEENARLRGLLGLDDRSSDGHRFAWNPTLLSQASELVEVDSASSDEMEVALLRTLFGAREDVFAFRWESTSTGKSGWSPAVRGGWSRSRAKKDYRPLTDEVLLAHVRGEQTLGIYPLLADDTCTLLACDFDKGTWLLDALAYLDVCHSQEVLISSERCAQLFWSHSRVIKPRTRPPSLHDVTEPHIMTALRRVNGSEDIDLRSRTATSVSADWPSLWSPEP